MPDFTLLHAPRISLVGFKALLSRAPDECQAVADQMYATLERSRVDPCFALSQAAGEHSLTWAGVAGKVLSFGNIRVSEDWQGPVYDRDTGVISYTPARYYERMAGQPKDPFKVYWSYLDGLSDWCRLIRHYVFDLDRETVSALASIYVGDGATDEEKQAYADRINGRIAAWAERWPT